MPTRPHLASAISEDMDFDADERRRDQINREALQLNKNCDMLEKQRYKEQLSMDRQISKLEDEIEFLKKENFEIELKFIEFSQESTNPLQEINENDSDSVNIQMVKEIDELSAINNQINDVRDEIENINTQIKAIPSEKCASDDGTLRSTETTLHLSKEKCSKLRSQNSEMRQKIKSLRDEYRILNENLTKVDQNLIHKQRAFAKLCQETSQFQEERQESASRIRALNERGKKILNSLENEEKSLSRAIANEIKLQEYLEGKFATRMLPFGGMNEDGDGEGRENKHKDRIDSPTTKRALSDYEIFMEKMANRESMKLIKGKDRLPTLIDKHQIKEKINFSRFNQINRLNSEIEKMQHSVESLRLENEEMDEEVTWSRSRVNDELKMLESEINRMHSCILVNNERAEQDDELLENVTTSIKKLCDDYGVDMAPIIELLGENQSKSFSVLSGQLEKQIYIILKMVKLSNQNSAASAKVQNSSNANGRKTVASAKSKQHGQLQNQFRAETAYTNQTNSKSFDFANSKINQERPNTSPLFDKLHNMKDSSDVDFELPKYPLTRQEIFGMIRETHGNEEDRPTEMLVPSNYSLEINSIHS